MAEQVAGYQALCDMYDLRVMPHFRKSYISSLGRGSSYNDGVTETHVYPNTYALKDSTDPFCQIEFALKYDGMNLEILEAAFQRIAEEDIIFYLGQHPNSKYSRVVWFLYEFLLNKQLKFSINSNIKYATILDPELYFVSAGVRSPRHRVINNLLGNNKFCPIIRRSKNLERYIEKEFDRKVIELTNKYDYRTIERANYYLFTKETLSSYKIEHEEPSKERTARFIQILQQASLIDELNERQLIELQNIIVDPRFKVSSYRENQNYVGDILNYHPRIHYISPKPESVRSLMSGLLASLDECLKSKVHPVIVAAAIAFGFVLIHPFEDGNGRIHRFLIHYILAKLNFTPEGAIFPVSAVMLQKIRDYDRILETFSQPLKNLITNFELTDDGVLTVLQETENFYRYIDFTRFTEYLFGCIEETLREHFEKELEFLVRYDKAKREIQNIVDMPDRLLELFIKFACQNYGKLSEQKRDKYFASLSEQEILSMQAIVKNNMLDNQ